MERKLVIIGLIGSLAGSVLLVSSFFLPWPTVFIRGDITEKATIPYQDDAVTIADPSQDIELIVPEQLEDRSVVIEDPSETFTIVRSCEDVETCKPHHYFHCFQHQVNAVLHCENGVVRWYD